MLATAPLIYILCFITSSVCAALLVRGYLRNRTRFLMFSALCFVLLALNNLIAVADLVVLQEAADLRLARLLASLAAVAVLLYSFVWETD